MPTVAQNSAAARRRLGRQRPVALRALPAPAIVRAAGSTARLNAIISVAVSVVSHTVVLAALSMAGGRGRMVWVSVQSGVASIELQASMAATPSPGEDRPLDPAVMEPAKSEPRGPEPPVLLALADVSVTPVTRDAAQPAMPRMEPPGVAETVVRPPTAPALEQRVLHDQSAPSDKPDPSVQSVPHPPRTAVGRRLAKGLVPSTAQSAPSPASVASRGAQSDLPAIVYNPAPTYPADALNARVTGRVLLRVVVAADGSVVRAAIHRPSGVDSLDAAALEAVRQWRFSESPRGSAARELIVPIRFRIEDSQ